MFRFGSTNRFLNQSGPSASRPTTALDVPVLLSSNNSYLMDFIDPNNRDLTVLLGGFLAMFAARQRTGERRGVI